MDMQNATVTARSMPAHFEWPTHTHLRPWPSTFKFDFASYAKHDGSNPVHTDILL